MGMDLLNCVAIFQLGDFFNANKTLPLWPVKYVTAGHGPNQDTEDWGAAGGRFCDNDNFNTVRLLFEEHQIPHQNYTYEYLAN